MSTQIISLKDRTDLRESSPILALETIRVWAAAPGICRSAQCYHPAGVLAQTLVIDLCSLRRRAHCGNFCQSTLLFVDIPSRSSNVLSGLGKAIAFANHVKAEQVWGGCHPRMHHAGAPAPA
jgi:hypothetical protein